MLHSRRMFGMGIGELLIIAVVALLVIGPEKLPEAAKSLSKGIRDIRKQTRELQDTLEDDTDIGDAIRDLKSAWHGDVATPPPPRKRQQGRVGSSATGDPGPGEGTAAALSSGQTARQTSGTGAAAGGSTPEAAPARDESSDQPASPTSGSSFPEPVIRPPSNAIAREPVGVASATPAPATESPAEPSSPRPAAAEQSAPEKAHG